MSDQTQQAPEGGPVPKSKYACSYPGCERHPSKGDLIIRVSPKGGPFEGRCPEHVPEDATGSEGTTGS